MKAIWINDKNSDNEIMILIHRRYSVNECSVNECSVNGIV